VGEVKACQIVTEAQFPAQHSITCMHFTMNPSLGRSRDEIGKHFSSQADLRRALTMLCRDRQQCCILLSLSVLDSLSKISLSFVTDLFQHISSVLT